ncbi:hypothetical protein DDU33_09890 [Actinobacillus porcitonsillarum]|uniref:Uncharacterized protein n=1 Tax=Actinobacillus porcitonsillarum TaxID=189834 RepID=A0A2U8FLA4_9PAST|nr:hypothetical protein [Actinobacillus porcitonsillarum]AWI51775.1 hypothetical protein DDU33_09890 [Actinobacillus porcitonsillarum]
MKKLFFIFSIICLSACSLGKFDAYKAKPDNFAPGVEHYFSGDLYYQENDFGGPGIGTFNIHAFRKENNLSWEVHTRWISASSKLLFPQSIAFNVDGKILTFNNLAIANTSSFGLSVVQNQNFVVSDELIDLFSNANSIIVRVSGTQYYLERTLTPEDIKNIKWYISYIKAGNVPQIVK